MRRRSVAARALSGLSGLLEVIQVASDRGRSVWGTPVHDGMGALSIMMVITGIVLLASFVIAGIVGIKLWRLGADDWLAPERMLAVYFLVSHLIGGVMMTIAYGAWSSMGRAESPDWLIWINGVGQHLLAIGFATILLFTQRTFHPGVRWAETLAWLAIGVLVLSLLGRLLWEGFAISISGGTFHWAAFAVRMLALCWAGVSACAYWVRMRKRMKLGLADPLLVNRFLLWGGWAIGNLIIALSEPAARLIYSWTAGDAAMTADHITGVAGPIIQITLSVTSVFGSLTTIALFLTFFPTEGYKRWVMRQTGPPGV